MQSAIHEGYEYQDYFSVSIILQLMLQRKDAEIIVDRKDFNGDKFDDLKVKLSNGLSILTRKVPITLQKVTCQMEMDMILRYTIFLHLGKREKNPKIILR